MPSSGSGHFRQMLDENCRREVIGCSPRRSFVALKIPTGGTSACEARGARARPAANLTSLR
jgi:hypothetical protein